MRAVANLDDYRAFRRDTDTHRAAVSEVLRRHGLAGNEVQPVPHGTHLVWMTADRVIKIFAPLWPSDSRVETTLLQHLSGKGLPVPQLEAVGEIDGWPYVVMHRLPGRPIGMVWRDLDPDRRERLAGKLGELIGRIAGLSTSGLEHLATSQETLICERMASIESDQRKRGAGPDLLAEIMAVVHAMPPPPPAPSVLLHADLTDDNVLVAEGEITGLIDFGDAFVGPWTYELAAPACLVIRGDRNCGRALLAGLGVESSDEIARAVRTWAVLHRYADIPALMQEAGAGSVDSWLHSVWPG